MTARFAVRPDMANMASMAKVVNMASVLQCSPYGLAYMAHMDMASDAVRVALCAKYGPCCYGMSVCCRSYNYEGLVLTILTPSRVFRNMKDP